MKRFTSLQKLGEIDVLIAAWNRSDTIERAVSSALAEPNVRTVIVVDDGSVDDTAARAMRMDQKTGRVAVRTLHSNRGPSAARNVGLEMSKAPWIAILDADDFLLPGRMAKMLRYANDDWDFVADNILQVRDSQDEMQLSLFENSFEPWRLDLETFVLGSSGHRRTERWELAFFKPLIRRAFLDRRQLRYDENLRLGEDYSLYARALAGGARFLVVPPQGYVSMVRPDSISGRHTKQDLERYRDVDIAMGSIAGLTRRECRALRKHYRGVDGRVQWLSVIEAFKSRSISRFLTPFARSPRVSLFLMNRLIAELSSRLRNHR